MAARPRQPYEECDFCYLERVALTDRKVKAPVPFEVPCICSSETVCGSKFCKWGKKYGETTKSLRQRAREMRKYKKEDAA